MVGVTQEAHPVSNLNIRNQSTRHQDHTITQQAPTYQLGTEPMIGIAEKATTEMLEVQAFRLPLPRTWLATIAVHQQQGPTVTATVGVSIHSTEPHSHM